MFLATEADEFIRRSLYVELLQKPRYAKVALVCLLFVLLLSSSEAMALTIPNPPDTSAPGNTQSGPLQNAQPFPGGVSLVKDTSVVQNVSANEYVVQFFCIEGHNPYVYKQFRTSVGESISGPITSEQASGIVDAVNSIAPPKAENITVTVGGIDTEGNITYIMTGMLYNVTTYSVWVTSQQSPALQQRVGYVVVSVPMKPVIERDFLDLTGSDCELYALTKWGPGWNSNASSSVIRSSSAWLRDPLADIAALPVGGVPPIISYGPVSILSSAGVAAAAEINPGQNVTFALPPGSYTAVSKVDVLGISFSVNCGSYSSGAGATAAQFTVTLAGVENVWHEVEALGVIILVAVVLLIFWRFKLWPHVARAYRRVSRRIHDWVDERMRASRGEAPNWLEHATSPGLRAAIRFLGASGSGSRPSLAHAMAAVRQTL